MLTSIPQFVKDAQVIFVNHSGGKDSQAMAAALRKAGLLDKMVFVHADLGEMEWEPMAGFIAKNAFGKEVHVVGSHQSFFDLCRKYKRLPSSQARFCTSELKTKPIKDFIRSYCERNGITKAVNAIGIRAEESKSRAKKNPWQLSKVSLKDRSTKQFQLECWDWYPIFDYKLDQVWLEIANTSQVPHKLYKQGFSRLSCVFCVFGKVAEHKLAAKMKPELYGKMVELEKELGKTIRVKQVDGVKVKKGLEETCGPVLKKPEVELVLEGFDAELSDKSRIGLSEVYEAVRYPKSIKTLEFESPLVRETGYGASNVAKMAKCSAELYQYRPGKEGKCVYQVEFVFGLNGEYGVEHLNLYTRDGIVNDYDGMFRMNEYAAQLARSAGLTVPDSLVD